MEEIWKCIDGYEGLYQISNFGNVKKEGRFLFPSQANGYLNIALHKNKKSQNKAIHQLVASAFIKNPYKRKEVNHKDGNRSNNYVDNLEWVSHSDNILHSYHYLRKKNKDFWY